jgi:glycosyltransferase involved in cell wall biosynthesis
MSALKKRICIISLSLPIETDIRLLKQIEYLASHYDTTVIGYGDPTRTKEYIGEWMPIDRAQSSTRQIVERAIIFAGKLFPMLYDIWYWQRPRYRQALQYARTSRADAFLADDWAAIPIAARAAKDNQPIVFDADEYWPGEVESSRAWKLFFSPLIVHIMRKHIGVVDASTTVSKPLADRYYEEFRLEPILVYNAPKYVEIAKREIDPEHITLIHQGSPVPNRRLETLIEAMAQVDQRYTLHMMLTGAQDDPYLLSLKQLTQKLARGRVFFYPPVYPTEIVQTIARYDIGISVIPPATFTYHVALPNKLFESVVAGQAVIVGPSPAMVDVVNTYGIGYVTKDFSAGALAKTLNALTTEQIRVMRHRSREAAKVLNAEVEMTKMVDLFAHLLGGK